MPEILLSYNKFQMEYNKIQKLTSCFKNNFLFLNLLEYLLENIHFLLPKDLAQNSFDILISWVIKAHSDLKELLAFLYRLSPQFPMCSEL